MASRPELLALKFGEERKEEREREEGKQRKWQEEKQKKIWKEFCFNDQLLQNKFP